MTSILGFLGYANEKSAVENTAALIFRDFYPHVVLRVDTAGYIIRTAVSQKDIESVLSFRRCCGNGFKIDTGEGYSWRQDALCDHLIIADTQAGAAAGTKGAAVSTTFHDGMAVFMRTKKGLMASADVSGTKYWKSKLND